MFDEYGPHGAEEERESYWTDLSDANDDSEESLPPLVPDVMPEKEE